MAVARIIMYSRKRCGLCDEARAVILGQHPARRVEFEEVFIDGDDELERAYGLRVPVVLVNGIEEFETQVDPEALAQLLEPLGGPGD